MQNVFFVFHIFRDRHYGRLEQIWRGRRVLRQQSFNTGACSPYLDHDDGGGGDDDDGDEGDDVKKDCVGKPISNDICID